MHPGPIGIEDAGDLDSEVMLAAIVEEEGFRTPFSFVITGAGADTVDISPVTFGLGMEGGVSIDLRGGGLQDFSPETLGQAQHIDGAMDIDLRGLNRIILIMDGGGRTGKIVDFIHFDIEGKGDVMAKELEIGLIQEVGDISFGSCIEVVDTEDILTVPEQAFTEVGAHKPGTACDQNSLLIGFLHSALPFFAVTLNQNLKNILIDFDPGLCP